jgi:hypothetical protein
MVGCSSTGPFQMMRRPMGAGARGSCGLAGIDRDRSAAIGCGAAAVDRGCPAVALSIFFLRQNVAPRAVRERLTLRGGFDALAAGTVPPAFATAFEFPDWESAVRTAICRGGDADTLARITGGVAEALHGPPDDVATRARAHLTDDLRRVVARFEQSVAQLRYAERHRRRSAKDV